jgi:hypothetical protein
MPDAAVNARLPCGLCLSGRGRRGKKSLVEERHPYRSVVGSMAATVNILERPIERIRETCELMGARDKFERALPELETYLEGEIAGGETSETRLTFDGLCFLKQAFF